MEYMPEAWATADGCGGATHAQGGSDCTSALQRKAKYGRCGPAEVGTVGPPWSAWEGALGSAQELHFMVNGDWGCPAISQPPPSKWHCDGLAAAYGCPGGAHGQTAVAAAMAFSADKVPVDFVLSMGDNVYEFGLQSQEDPWFQRAFFEMYSATSLKVPWYGVLGNHDWKMNASAQVVQIGNWKIPALSYALKGSVGGVPIAIFAIDTNAAEAEEICYKRDHGPWGPMTVQEKVRCFDEIDGIFNRSLQWLNETLGTFHTTCGEKCIKLVMGHEPIYGSGEFAFNRHSPRAPGFLEQRLDPLLQAYGVHAYFDGHDHLVQHLQYRSTQYYIIGSGGRGGPLNATEFDKNVSYRATKATKMGHVLGEFAYGRAKVNATHLCVRVLAAADEAGVSYGGEGLEKYSHCSAHFPPSVF